MGLSTELVEKLLEGGRRSSDLWIKLDFGPEFGWTSVSIAR